MGYDLLYALWFFVPAGAANVAPVLVAKAPWLQNWDTPLDCGTHYRGKRLLGKSKTWRGLLCGVIFAVIVFALQQVLAGHLGSFTAYLRTVNYTNMSALLGILLGAGALIGDAVESFFKRQLSVEPGTSWFPFDQLDYIVGGCLFASVVVTLPLKIYAYIIILWFMIHLISSYLGHLLHLKKAPI